MTDRKQYKREHWEQYKKTRKRVYGTLTLAQHRALKARAASCGQSPFQQLWLESQGYLKQERVLSTAEQELLQNLRLQIRAIGNNLNQLAKKSNALGRFIDDRQTRKELLALEQTVQDFLQRR